VFGVLGRNVGKWEKKTKAFAWKNDSVRNPKRLRSKSEATAFVSSVEIVAGWGAMSGGHGGRAGKTK
jgi:hypothetical protein